MKRIRFVAISSACLLAAVALGGCQTIEQKRKIDYKSTRTLPPLEVPPDLSSLPSDKAAPTVGAQASATFSEFAERRTQPLNAGAAAVLPQYPDIRVARDGQMRWLVVRASPEALWTQVREFVLASGLLIARENPATGVIETEWAENRAKVGSASQMVLAKWLGTLYSTGTRDRFRLRLERGQQEGTTEIFLGHQGMEEVVAQAGLGSSGAAEKTLWQPRPSEPELEAEMLRLLMVHLGEKEPQKQLAAAAQAPVAERAQLKRVDSAVAFLTLEDSLERAWRRVGLSLDRIGFTVEDRDRSKGIYYVRYIDPDKEQKKKGFFSRMFSGEQKPPQDQYQIHLEEIAAGTQVEVLTKAGEPDQSKTGERILSLLYEQLK